jgi:hypothetical protein
MLRQGGPLLTTDGIASHGLVQHMWPCRQHGISIPVPISEGPTRQRPPPSPHAGAYKSDDPQPLTWSSNLAKWSPHDERTHAGPSSVVRRR